jgi:WD40 repeat protein
MAVDELPAADVPEPGRATTPEEFGRELTLLRQRAGLTVRQVAAAARIPVSTAGDYFAGRHLPAGAQSGTLREIVRVCGEAGPGQVDAWIQALGRVRRTPGRRPAGAPAPYRGLAPFEAEDAQWFFGRDELIRLLADVVADGALGIPVTVTGASGSGKSSLVRAGLIPRLGSGTVVLMTPGASPMTTLTQQLGQDRLAIVVDQFEEVFTACEDPGERREFIAALSALSADAVVLLGLRADFYGHALRHPALAESLQRRQVVVGPMTRDQLHQAIVVPARKARLTLDPGLPELLLGDLAPRAGHDDAGPAGYEAGTLPLLSHALRATWERARGGRLTVADYQAAGGIWNAVARTAEAAYAELDGQQQELARRLFLSLVHVTDGSPLTRARVQLDELPGRAADGGTGGEVLARFVDKRLVTVDEDSARITHEALLNAWPRLQGWISADRDGMRVRHRITSAAVAWQEAGRDDAALLRGALLATAAEWTTQAANRDSLSRLARNFLDCALAHERARAAAERRQVSRLRRLAASLAALALVAAGLAAYAFQQRHDVGVARDQADSREVAVEADQVRSEDPSLAAQLSLAAYQISPTPGALASLLESASSPAAARFLDSASVVEALALSADRRTLAVASADGTLRLWDVAQPGHPSPDGGPVATVPDRPLYAAAFSPDGHVLAAAGAGDTVGLWDVADPRHPVRLGRPLTGPRNTVYSLAFSPRGGILAAGSADDTVRLWDVADPMHPVPLGGALSGPAGYVEAVAFSPDGTILAAASADKTVRLWDVAQPRRPVPLGRPLTGPADMVDTVAFSPDGHTLAAGSRDNSVWLWDIANPAHPVRARAPLTQASDWVNAVAFSPDGRTLAAASSDDQVLLWNAATGALLGTLPGPQPATSLAWDGDSVLVAGGADGMVRLWSLPAPVLLDSGPISQVSFSPDGKLLAVAGPDLRLWNPVTRTQVASVAVPGAFTGTVAWSPSGTVLAAGYSDGTVRLWRVARGGLTPLGTPLSATGSGIVEFVAFRHDGQVLASGADDGTVRLWNLADPARPRQLAVVHDSGTYVFSIAFSPNGNLLAAASADNLTRLWNVSDPARPRLVGQPLAGPSSYAISVAFSPDGHVLAIGSADKTVRLWNVTDPGRPRPLGGPLTGPGGYVYSVAFSPDGAMIAAGVTDGTIWLWDVSDPARPTPITHVTDAVTATGHVYTVAFSPDGSTLAAGSSDGSTRLWDTQPAAAAALVCATAGQQLTVAEWHAYIPGRPYDPPCARQ